MANDLNSSNAMLDYLKSLDDIQVPQNDDLAPFELMAHIFDNKLYEYN